MASWLECPSPALLTIFDETNVTVGWLPVGGLSVSILVAGTSMGVERLMWSHKEGIVKGLPASSSTSFSES